MNRVSVIIPIYNAEKYLDRTLSCFLKQDYNDYEVIAVNDCSTDNTIKIIESYIALFQKKGVKLRIVDKVINEGLCAALNSGLTIAEGQYLCFPDADDEVDETYLSSMMSVLLTENNRWVRCNYVICLDDENREYDVILPTSSVYLNDFYDFISKYIPHNVWNMIIEKNYFIECVGTQLYDSKLTQEWSILLPLAYNSNYARCDKKLYKYHIKSNAMSAWRNGDIDSVINHINALEELNVVILDRIKNITDDDKKIAVKALEIYYHMLKSRKYAEKGITKQAESEEDKVFELCDDIVDSEVIKEKIHNVDMYTRIAFDKLLNADVSFAVNDYIYYLNSISNGYMIVYDKGGKEIIDMIRSVYGEPLVVLDYVLFTQQDDKKVPIMCLIQNSKVYREFTDTNPKEIFLEYRQVRNSIRGWAAEKD